MKFFEKDIRIKITAILLLLVLFALISAIAVSTTIVNGIIRDNIEDSMIDSACMTRNMLEVALESRQARMQLMANYPVMRDPAADAAAKSSVLALFLETWPIGKGSVMLDTAGNPICGTGNLVNMGNVTGTSWFDNAQTARIAFAFVHGDRELAQVSCNSPVLAVSSPVRDPKDQIFAYVASFTTPSDIKKAIEGVKIKQTGHAFLMDRNGVFIAGNLFGSGTPGTREDSKQTEDLAHDMARGVSGKSTITFKGKKYLVTYIPVEPTGARHPELDWSIGIVVPSSEAYAPSSLITWSLLGLAVFIAACSVVAAILLGRSITRPIDELVAGAESIGSGDLTGGVAIRTRDQVGALAAAFLRMRDQLRSTLGEAGYSADKMSILAAEQSAASGNVFEDTEDIVDSVVVLAKNMEAQTRKIRKIMEYTGRMPEDILTSETFQEVRELLQESEILAEVGANKAVEIASAAQDQRAAARDVAAAARRLSSTAMELKNMVMRFKV